MYKKIKLLGIAGLLGISMLQAQTENSPYSRYGLGDQLPEQNIMSRAMGGVSAAYYDYQTINFLNPASYSRLKLTTFDFGVEVDSRTLRVSDPPRKFSAASPIISYIMLGFPLSKKRNWGMTFGLKPVDRINYKLERYERLPGIDSVNTLFEGNGGSYQVHTGTGIALKNFSVGVNVGYMFGSKNYSAERTFIPDSAGSFYYPSSFQTKANYGGLFVNGGLQYTQKLSSTSILRFGAYGSLSRNFRASKDVLAQTYSASERGNVKIDSIYENDVIGKVTNPASYGFGLMYNKSEKFMFGADFTGTKWSEYRFFNEVDSVQDSWKVHVGGQVTPNLFGAKSYWGRVAYRAGFTYGQDYIRVNKDLPVWGVSFGAGLPMRKQNYSNQHSIINVTVEFGQRGNKVNIIRENYLRIAVGFTLSDIWFIKKQYD